MAPWQRRLTRRTFLSTTAVAGGALAIRLPSPAAARQGGEGGILTLGREGNTSFSRNFNPFSPNALWPTVYAMYEPLVVYARAAGQTIPRLATEFRWSEDGQQLTFMIRPNVLWSDGQPFTARDVAFTFDLVQRVLPDSFDYLASVETPDDATVVCAFSRVYSPALDELGGQVIVPEHVWASIADPLKETNPDPVATGPFTEIANFQTQVYEVHKNPNYWEPGKPYIQGVRVPAYPGNDQVNLALANGETDWADVFIPDVENTYVAKDPKHRSFWYPKIWGTAHLYLNTTKPPFDDPNVRKAISMAINRDQINLVALYGNVEPADATGIGPRYGPWRNPDALAPGDWAKRDVDKANELLDAAGLARGSGGTRALPDGSPMSYSVIVGATSTDWVASCQVISQNLQEIGIDVEVRGQDWGAVIESMQKGEFDMAHAWSSESVTPYAFFRGVMSSQTKKPIGETANENYHRFADPRADDLLSQFAGTFDPEQQQAIVDQLQALYVEVAPAVPLFYGPEFGEFTTTRFTGFPSESDPYADSNSRYPTAAIVLTTVKPVA